MYQTDGLNVIYCPSVAVVELTDSRFEYINTQGMRVFDVDFSCAHHFYDGLAVVRLDNDRFGYINTQGRQAFETSFVNLSVVDGSLTCLDFKSRGINGFFFDFPVIQWIRV